MSPLKIRKAPPCQFRLHLARPFRTAQESGHNPWPCMVENEPAWLAVVNPACFPAAADNIESLTVPRST